MESTNRDPVYVLGHSKGELDRLIRQSRLFGELTEQVLMKAGLAPGMRVLDVGCGAGDVSLLCAGLVGRGGRVLGVDRSPEAITLARQRAASAATHNLEFVAGDLSDFTPDESFDALVGRLVLMYLADPVALLRRLSGFVRPGGLIVFQEMWVAPTTSWPRCPETERAIERIAQTFKRCRIDPNFGLRLRETFVRAGLGTPELIGGCRVESGPDTGVYALVEELTRSLLPFMEKSGVATAKEVAVDTLAERLRREVVASGAVFVAPTLIGAWTRRNGL